MQQATRISDKTAFFLHGEIVEFDETQRIFSNPKEQKTLEYIKGGEYRCSLSKGVFKLFV